MISSVFRQQTLPETAVVASDATARVSRRDTTVGRKSARVALALLVLFVVSYVVYFSYRSTIQYRGYGDGTFDLGFYDQGIWLLSRFHAPYVTLMGRDLFGDHAQFLVLALVPLDWLRPDPTTLFAIQSLMLALGAVPVYLLARRRLQVPLYAALLAGVFLLHPALGLTNLENYHPDSFLVPLLGFAIYGALERRPRLFVICSVLALLCKEDAVLVVLPIAVWYALRRDRRVGAILAAAAIAAAFAATNLVMRPLVGVSTRNAFRIPFSSCARACSVTRHMIDFSKTLATRPATVVRYLLAGDRPNGRPFYAWQMLAPTGLVFVVAPEVAAMALLAFTSNVISTYSFQHQIAYHYSMELLPALAMGTVYALSRIANDRRRAIAVTAVCCSALTCALLWGPFPWSRHPNAGHTTLAPSAAAAIDRIVAHVPANAAISVYDMFAPHVDHRVQVYLWPTPFAASHWKLFQQEGQRLPQADTIQYLLLPTDLHDHPEVLAELDREFIEIAHAENAYGQGAALYQRTTSPAMSS
jgi:uncharacterized membrane protein